MKTRILLGFTVLYRLRLPLGMARDSAKPWRHGTCN